MHQFKYINFYILDPCDKSNQGTLYREKYRGTLCPHRIGKTTFDREITEKWYKVNGVDGPLSMPTEPVPIFHCSTEFPGWLNGICSVSLIISCLYFFRSRIQLNIY